MQIIHSIATLGSQAILVTIEISATSGIPEIVLIGLANKTIVESKDRIVTALKNLGVRIRARKIVINLRPADLKKEGSQYDLAIAVGLLNLLNNAQIETRDAVFLGELSLDGSLQPIGDIVSKVLATKKLGFKTIYIPEENAQSASAVAGIEIKPLKKLSQLISHQFIVPVHQTRRAGKSNNSENSIRFNSLQHQDNIKRALMIALAGHHHLHLVGPPGVGKTSLAQAAQALQPELTLDQVLESVRIYETAQEEFPNSQPFRAPDHTLTITQLVGNNRTLKPGEASLAHNGILFLDEVSEEPTQVLLRLRKLLDEKKVILNNSKAKSEYPANFILMAASNPCPCGFWRTDIRACRCSRAQRERFAKKLSGALLDRIDMQLHVGQKPDKNNSESISIDVAQKYISDAKQKQAHRFSNSRLSNNGELNYENYVQYCDLSEAADNQLQRAILKHRLSYRAIGKLIGVSQTIADIANSTNIQPKNILEALSYRFELNWEAVAP